MALKGQGDELQQQGAGKGPPAKKPALKGDSSSGRAKSKGAGKGSARVPITMMTVEYVDDSQGMEAALQALEQRVNRLDRLLGSLEETHGEMGSAVNQQSRQIQKLVDSISRRVGRIGKTVEEAKASLVAAAPQFVEEGPPQRFASDMDHQEAWRSARILAAELEANHPKEVKEGVLSGNFHEALSQQIEELRKAYEQRVPERVVQEHDYLVAAIDALIARLKRDLQAQQ